MKFNKIWFKKKIKSFLYFCIFYSGLLSIFLMIFKKIKKKHSAVILLYHQIVDNSTRNYLYKSTAIHHHLSDFKTEMAFVKRWFNVISLDEIVDNIKSKKAFKTSSIAITFDDGYRDNYTLAYSVLKEFNFPATIYLVSGLAGTNKRTWLDEIEYALLNSNIDSFKFPELFGGEVLFISSLKDKEKVNSRIGEAMKTVSNSKRLELMDELFVRLEVEKNPGESKDRRILNWEEVKEMGRNHISFGAHTNSHPVLTKISFDEAKREILLSKTKMEKELGIPIKHFAFPNGRDKDFNNELKDYCIDLGFETIATAEYGTTDKDSNPYYLLRFIPLVPLYIFAIELTRLFVFSKKYAKRMEYGQN